MSTTNLLPYVVYSPNESAVSDGAGFWSNDDGWTEFSGATRFSEHEMQTMHLPDATGGDAKWVRWDEANASYGSPVSVAG